jgi:phage tail sheath protein FI
MATLPTFGITTPIIDEESRPAIAADLSTIGIIGASNDAVAAAFPLNTPVGFDSDQLTMTRQIGTGPLADAIAGINDQLGEMQFAARVVVVRVAEGVSTDPVIKAQQTISNIVGSSLDGTGIWAFLKSAQTLGVIPRLIIAPGYTGQMANGVGTVTQVLPGANYIADTSYPVVFSGGGATAIQATGHAIGLTGGALGPVILDTPGAWYTTVPTVVAPSAGKHVTVAAVAGAGTDYAVSDHITLDNGVVLNVTTIGALGIITAVSVITSGLLDAALPDPTNPQVQVSTTGIGTGATFTLTWVAYTAATYTVEDISLGANPVCASLTSVLNQLVAHAVVESSGQSQVNDDLWRSTLNSKRLIPVSGGCRVLDTTSGLVLFKPIAPRVVGVAVRQDAAHGGAPFFSWANQAIQGIIGPMRDIPFALTDGNNEAQELLRDNIGVVVRGEVGNDFAIAAGGFVFVGTDNAGEDELWRFYNQVRGRDFILLTAIRATRFYLGRYNITPHTVQAVINTIKGILRDLTSDGNLLGYKMQFNPKSNSADEIRLGHLVIGFAAEEPAPFRLLTIQSTRYRPAIDSMIADLSTQLNLTA